ncbi:unnamed protein product [Arctia plantaginis]|uniref:Uncharacterized protein n=1 Tax=Arctia plantaginis TaxID=874455 RepID=A0A8S1A5N1_ARCPL|nr:unnamed protein product [Arctia plantaginis]
MFSLNENYYLRKCFLERGQVPTQSTMKEKMSPALANVYFKSMIPKLKLLAGLEPPMKGAGKDWFVPPKDLLEGRTVMKPFKRECMKEWNCYGVDKVAMKLIEEYHLQMREECNRKLHESDLEWERIVEELSCEMWNKCSKTEASYNTDYLRNAFAEFTNLYTKSIVKLETLMFDATVNKIKSFREETFQKMRSKYEYLLQEQSIMLRDRYTRKLNEEKKRMKTEFIRNLEIARTNFGDKLHDIKLEKHVAIEKLRNYLECQNLACQIYVALKERQECLAEIELKKHEHTKTAKALTKTLTYKDFEVKLAQKKDKAQKEFNQIWKKKVCHVVKNFQMFVSYCLKMLPEQADFFINMETLMLLQLSEALEQPSAYSLIELDFEQFHTPVPKPHPFYLFCDKNHKPNVNQNFCPKHCTSSASQFPVIIINKRCIYAACDNFEQFTDRIKQYIHGEVLNDADFKDDKNYAFTVPVNYTPSRQLRELKLESSLLQVLEQEITNIQKVNFMCSGCQIAHCFDCDRVSSHSQQTLLSQIETKMQASLPSIPSGKKFSTREAELTHEREPKWDSYMKYVHSKKCECSKMAKKHLQEHLPTYMRKMSYYDAPQLLNYKTCSVKQLKSLVKEARGKKDPIPPPPKVPPKSKDIGTQCSDHEFEELCTCFSADSLLKFMKMLPKRKQELLRDVGRSISESLLTQERMAFSRERAYSLMQLIKEAPDVKEIFKRQDCEFK